MDTIFALASARGKAGVSVIRVSGSDALRICERLCKLPRKRKLLPLVWNGKILDEALVLVFAQGKSFTGEDVVELHTHGSIAVVDAVSRALSAAGARMAEPGEFTRRALENNQIDLAQVEGLSDLIEAETELQRSQALSLMQGNLSDKVESWRRQLIRAAALIEATIDFADEDVPTDVTLEVGELLKRIQKDFLAEINGSYVAERIRDSFEVAIVGPPNIGKSTLLNCLAGREAAITSAVAGTTRDIIEIRMDLNGIPLTLLDTAGLRMSDDTVEKIGVARALERAESADIRVFLTEDGIIPAGLENKPGDVILLGKQDQGNGVSGITGNGVPELLKALTHELGNRASHARSAVRTRHRLAMENSNTYIQKAVNLLDQDADAELIAQEVRCALMSVDAVTGKVGVEDILDEIFSSFCLGK
ncbi:MAG: tRNA uridine-5-carboxymethylaminomethyl(34) synthesis GTPase MnmE [Rhodobacteraceae bacterium]|nr:tRNA uridine-5-carboxymethylaminomethyl(34) synthesis GTPase MnmE [Paracoccaceae bacterium]